MGLMYKGADKTFGQAGAYLRLLPGVLRLRDVDDVERHAAGHFEDVPLAAGHRRAEILRAIGDAHRVNLALAPERPLRPVLDALLSARATRLATEVAHVAGRAA